MRISDWSSDVCSSDLLHAGGSAPRNSPRIESEKSRNGRDGLRLEREALGGSSRRPPMATVHSQSSDPRSVSAGYKVDISRGQRIGRVSSEWFSRPDDERYLSLSDLHAAVKARADRATARTRPEEHTSELQSLMRISYAVFCLKKKNNTRTITET